MFLIVGDLHLHERKEFSVTTELGLSSRLLEGLNILDQIYAIAKTDNIKDIIFTGDIFELKDRIPNHVLVSFAEKINLLSSQATIYIVRGNHDFKFPEYPILRAIKSVGFYDTPTIKVIEYQKVAFLPFYRDKQIFKNAWENLHRHRRFDILIFHQEVPGAYYASSVKVPGDWDLAINPDVLYVGGHIHQYQQVPIPAINGIIHYIGTPYHIDFDDVGHEKHIFKVQHKDIIPIRLNYPEFVDLDVNGSLKWGVDWEWAKDWAGCYVRFVGTVEAGKRQFIKNAKQTLLDLGVKGVKIHVKYLAEETVKRLKSDKGQRKNVIREYVESSQTSLDKDKLIETGMGFMK